MSTIQTNSFTPTPSLKALLTRRGFRYLGRGDEAQIVRPKVTSNQIAKEYYDSLGDYTFRKVLRHLIARKRPVDNQEILSMCAEPTLGQVRDFLVRSAIVEVTKDERWNLKEQVDSFGYTLEWYVSQLLTRELGAISEWSVKIDGLLAGGDLDVLAFIDSVLLYIECKAKRTEEIGESEVRNFLQRSQDMAPELAIMLIDTDSELDSLLNRFQTILLPIQRVASGIRDQNWKSEKPFIAKVIGFHRMYFGLQRIFVTYSQPSIQHALQDCLRYYHTYVKFASFWGGPRMNYLTGEVIDG
jgi:hypothetical protein